MRSENNSDSTPECLLFCTHKYEILHDIGEGTFSTVYKAKSKHTGDFVAIKAITKTSAQNRVAEELNILKLLEGKNNCIELLEVMRNQDQILMVFPYVPFTNFKDLILKCTIYDIKKYLYCLINSVAHMHRNNIIHRDLKPGNFLYDVESQMGYLIDFGLAHVSKQIEQPVPVENPVTFFNSIVKLSKPPGYYVDDSRPPMKAPRAGTRGFRAPEILFKSVNQNKSIDMWSIGVILLSLLTGQYPFFMSASDIDGLVELALILGHGEMRRVAKHNGRVWKSNLSTIQENGIQFETLIRSLNPNLEIDENTLDLLEGLLDPINTTRLTAEEAMKHQFFTDA